MRAFVVVEISIHDPETYERYKTMAPPSIAQYKGKYLVRGATTEMLLVEGPEFDPSKR